MKGEDADAFERHAPDGTAQQTGAASADAAAATNMMTHGGACMLKKKLKNINYLACKEKSIEVFSELCFLASQAHRARGGAGL